MSKWTPGPWREGRPGTVVADAPIEGMPMGADDVGYYGGNLIGESMTRANARRIVACVNACADVPTDMLKPGLVREMTETMDILLHIIYQFDRNHVFRRMFATSLEDAGEYVAKLRGEAS